MTSAPRSDRRRKWLLTIVAYLAMAVQLLVALAPLGEERAGRSFAAHAESQGTNGHYAHDDASCAACQARSIHGATSRPPVPLIEDALTSALVVAVVDRVVTPDRHLPANPRAPPLVT